MSRETSVDINTALDLQIAMAMASAELEFRIMQNKMAEKV